MASTLDDEDNSRQLDASSQNCDELIATVRLLTEDNKDNHRTYT